LKDFLADVSVDPDKDTNDDDVEYLTLSTVHSAKGLEWGRVFLIGLVDGVFPSSRSFDEGDGGDIEEEKRLLYVAVTRAKEELIMSYYTKKGVNERSKAALCRFLDRANVQKTFEARTEKPSIKTPRR
jgi:DNA helicase-2/ATP-dependent DNA helicase PcrA